MDAGKYAKVNHIGSTLRGGDIRLEVLDSAAVWADLTGFGTHPLQATNPRRYSMAVNGPWRITFEFREGDAYLVDLEQHH